MKMYFTEVKVNPNALRFSQKTIAPKLRSGKPLGEILRKLKRGVLRPEDLPRLQVCVDENGVLWSNHNKLLWLFRKAGISQITVKLFSKPMYIIPRDIDGNRALMSTQDFFPRIRGDWQETTLTFDNMNPFQFLFFIVFALVVACCTLMAVFQETTFFSRFQRPSQETTFFSRFQRPSQETTFFSRFQRPSQETTFFSRFQRPSQETTFFSRFQGPWQEMASISTYDKINPIAFVLAFSSLMAVLAIASALLVGFACWKLFGLILGFAGWKLSALVLGFASVVGFAGWSCP